MKHLLLLANGLLGLSIVIPSILFLLAEIDVPHKMLISALLIIFGSFFSAAIHVRDLCARKVYSLSVPSEKNAAFQRAAICIMHGLIFFPRKFIFVCSDPHWTISTRKHQFCIRAVCNAAKESQYVTFGLLMLGVVCMGISGDFGPALRSTLQWVPNTKPLQMLLVVFASWFSCYLLFMGFGRLLEKVHNWK